MKKILLIIMAVGLLTVAVVGCGGPGIAAVGTDGAGAPPYPIDDVEPHPMPEVDPIDDGQDLIDDGESVLGPYYGSDNSEDKSKALLSVSGIIVGIEMVNDQKHIEIEDAEGNTAFLVLSDETVFPFSPDFTIGDEVTGWYCAYSPMIMIYPPQYTILVLSSRMGDDRNITADRFHAADISADRYYISQDEMFMFNIDENTEVILADGQDFSDGDLYGRRIVVIYGASTRSIPERATAEKLIVLFESIAPFF